MNEHEDCFRELAELDQEIATLHRTLAAREKQVELLSRCRMAWGHYQDDEVCDDCEVSLMLSTASEDASVIMEGGYHGTECWTAQAAAISIGLACAGSRAGTGEG